MKYATLRSNRGFTLVELMVVVAVLAIMASLAAPSFAQLLAGQRMRMAGYSLVSDLLLARSEAVKRGADVTMAPVSADWTQGWSLTTVTVGTPPVVQVLAVQERVGNGVTFTTSPASITFDRNGRPGVSTVVRFGLYDGTASKRCISLDPSGRPKSAKAQCPA